MADSVFQPAILAPVSPHAITLVFDLRAGKQPRAVLARLAEATHDASTLIALGEPLIRALGKSVPGLRSFAALQNKAISFPSTQGALWVSMGGDDRGHLLGRARKLRRALAEAFVLQEEVSTFRFDTGRDLTGYEDGTENPKGDAAHTAAIVTGSGSGLDGSSFVAAQRYRHDLDRFENLSRAEQDHTIGRLHETNEEIADAPASAHVKRSAQESFDPPAFMVRRSMPWGGVVEHGLYFVSFVRALDQFERVLRRMAGVEDGITDALLGFTTALSGGYYWCPPLRGGRLDLSRLDV
jgi:putative iron-dependent peroxidase